MSHPAVGEEIDKFFTSGRIRLFVHSPGVQNLFLIVSHAFVCCILDWDLRNRNPCEVFP
jgi:hypothetical protein